MKNLSAFVKDEFIKNQLFDNSVYVSTIEEAEHLVAEVNYGKYVNIVFKNSNIKEYFINNLYTKRPNANIINCNCTLDRFYEHNLGNLNGIIVFDNVKKCKHAEIIEEIQKHKSILIY